MLGKSVKYLLLFLLTVNLFGQESVTYFEKLGVVLPQELYFRYKTSDGSNWGANIKFMIGDTSYKMRFDELPDYELTFHKYAVDTAKSATTEDNDGYKYTLFNVREVNGVIKCKSNYAGTGKDGLIILARLSNTNLYGILEATTNNRQGQPAHGRLTVIGEMTLLATG